MGSTHIALTLANYLSSKLGMKTAYIELNASNQISCLSKAPEKKMFSYRGISFFPNATPASLADILNGNYRYFVIDVGVLNTYTTKEFFRCDKQFLICSSSKWRLPYEKEKLETLLKNNKNQNHVTVILNLCNQKSEASCLPYIHRCITYPFHQNPFQLEPKEFNAIYQILEL